MDCPKCHSELSVQELKYNDFYYCMNCGEHCETIELKCCRTPYVQVKQHEISNGMQLRNQCISCGCIGGNSLKKASITGYQRLEFTDKVKHETFQTERYKEANDRIQAYRTYFIENRESAKFKKYDAYLKSDEWRAKRARVLNRDNHLCQCCLIHTATQVHHTTYAHLYNEPLFELESVCDRCHESITAMDKNLPFNSIEVQLKKAS